MNEILLNFKNNKCKTLLCISSIFIIEFAPLILLICTLKDDDKYKYNILLFLLFFIFLKNLIFIFLYVIKNQFLYNFLEKVRTNIKFRFLLLFLFLLCDIVFICINTYIFHRHNYKSLTEVSSLYFGTLPIYALFLLFFSKKTAITNSPLWRNIIFLAEKILYFLISIATIFPILMVLFILFFISALMA